LALIIVVVGLSGCAMLAMRQARLQAAHELAEAQLRIGQHDDRLLVLYAEIAKLISPDQVMAQVREHGFELQPAVDAGWDPLIDDGPLDDVGNWNVDGEAEEPRP
jgi:cell division protein FtsL